MEINVEIKKLTKVDITYILSEAFKCPIWSENNVIDVCNNLLHYDYTTIINSKNIKFSMSLYRLYRGIELFIKNGGSAKLYKCDMFDCDNIIQYALFGTIIY